MARARGGSAGAVVAAVLFGILFVFALLAAIIFYTQQTELKVQRDKALADQGTYITPDLTNLQDVAAKITAANEGKGTVVRQYLDEVEQLRRLATGDAGSNAENIQKQMTGMGLQEGTNLIAEVSKLQATLKSAQQAAASATNDLKAAREELAAAQKQQSELAPRYTESVQTLNAKVVDMATQQTAYEQTVQQSKTQLEQQIEQVRADLNTQLGEREATIAQLQARIDDLNNQITTMQAKRTDVLVDNTIRPDGAVNSIVEGQPLVYIDLGRQRGVLAGMTFEVFPAGGLIKPNEFDEVRGKATVEVTTVEPHRATARIVRTERGTSVKPGDVIVNLAFDPNSTRRFYVYGSFDIENTGAPSLSDRKRIEAMVNRFGGEVLPELNYEADYLVLGEQPQLPAPPPPGTTDPAILSEYAIRKREYDTYQQLLGQARELKIPVLNQNRFLALMGYYER